MPKAQLIECVPNFSEGQNKEVIDQIAHAIQSVSEVQLLEVDPGYHANRTVMTFVGPPEQVVEAAFQSMKTAQQVIDMSKQTGTHPRFGGTDVCPLIPLANIKMEEVAMYARKLAQRVGEELGYPVYCYEYAAFHEERRNLAFLRKGEYEGLSQKLQQDRYKPDFGPAVFHSRSGSTAIGARKFLIAYNINLATKDVSVAQKIARQVRESGYWRQEEGGTKRHVKGILPAVKAIGWYIEEYACAQVSMNLVDYHTTAVHTVFDEVKKVALTYGVEVTGSELVGLTPLEVLLQAGRHYWDSDDEADEQALVKLAIERLGLADLRPFNPSRKVIEYCLK